MSTLGIFRTTALAACAALSCAVASTALAGSGTAIVDGTLDSVYGTSLSLQTIQTGFGNANGNLIGGAGGELDGMYACNDGTYLYVMLTGDLETNGNGLYVLFDKVANTSGATTLPVIPGSLDDLFGADSIGGTTMPASFNCDFGIFWKSFSNPLQYTYVVADIQATTGSTATPAANISTGATVNPMSSSDTLLGTTYKFGLNDANTAGVEGGTSNTLIAPSAIASVSTGFEIGIPLARLGLTTGQVVKMFALYSNGSFGGSLFASNQFLPPIPSNVGAFNVGGPPYDFGASGLKLNTVSYTVAPPPTAAGDWQLYN